MGVVKLVSTQCDEALLELMNFADTEMRMIYQNEKVYDVRNEASGWEDNSTRMLVSEEFQKEQCHCCLPSRD